MANRRPCIRAVLIGLAALIVSPIVSANAPPDARPADQNEPKAADDPAPDRAARLRLFDELVDKIRKYHAFAPAAFANLGRPWADELPALKVEFERADTLPKLKVALRHLGNSLHDGHCRFQPAARRQRRLAGFSLAMEWGEPPVYFVSRIADPANTGPIAAGDVLVGVDGVPAEALPTRWALESNANQRFTVAEDISQRLTHRDDFELEAAGRQVSHWTFRRGATGQTYTASTAWKPTPGNDDDEFRAPVKYDDVTCARLPERKYGPYRLVERGWGICIYLSDEAPYRNVPIVRQYTFGYNFNAGPFDPVYLLELDHHLLSRTLASRPKPDGLILPASGSGRSSRWTRRRRLRDVLVRAKAQHG
jgi:hypothetical protein